MMMIMMMIIQLRFERVLLVLWLQPRVSVDVDVQRFVHWWLYDPIDDDDGNDDSNDDDDDDDDDDTS
jgi:hypothetical protein